MTQKRNTGFLVFYHGALVEQCVGAIVCRVKQSELNGFALLVSAAAKVVERKENRLTCFRNINFRSVGKVSLSFVCE